MSDARMCVSDREDLFCLDRVGVEEADGPVDGHECQRQYRVVDKSEPKHFQILIFVVMKIRIIFRICQEYDHKCHPKLLFELSLMNIFSSASKINIYKFTKACKMQFLAPK